MALTSRRLPTRSASKLPKASPPASYVPPRITRAQVRRALRGRSDIRRATSLVLALNEEQERIRVRRSPDAVTYLEAEVLSEGRAAAETIRDEGAARLGQLIQQGTKLRGEIRLAEGDSARLAEYPCDGIYAELLTTTEAEQRQQVVTTQITQEAKNDSLKHRLVPKWLRWLVLLVPVVDFPLLTLFSGDIFNVAWDQVASGSGLVGALSSVVFGLLGTVVIAIGCPWPI